MRVFKPLIVLLFLVLICAGFGCKEIMKKEVHYQWIPIRVTATAYNSVPNQTVNAPNVAAWGDTLRPGMKCIAVSRDLLKKGLIRNTPVKIEGMDGIYIVLDKMHSRWENRIDIYMGEDVQSAKEWGRKRVNIEYGIPLPIEAETQKIP